MTDTHTLVRCNDCAELVPAAMVALTSPEIVCDTCRQAAYIMCSVCSTWTLTGDTLFAVDTLAVVPQPICERCWEQL